MAYTEYRCPCGETISAVGWTDGAHNAVWLWLKHNQDKHPEWLNEYDRTRTDNPLQG